MPAPAQCIHVWQLAVGLSEVTGRPPQYHMQLIIEAYKEIGHQPCGCQRYE